MRASSAPATRDEHVSRCAIVTLRTFAATVTTDFFPVAGAAHAGGARRPPTVRFR